MKINWNLVLSIITGITPIITAIAAIIALCLTSRQTKISNKQYLFEKRLKAYQNICDLVDAYGFNGHCLEGKCDINNIDIDECFRLLTKNSYINMPNAIIEYPTEENRQLVFTKFEMMLQLSKTIVFIFSGKEASMFSKFVDAYLSVIAILYQYKFAVANQDKEIERKYFEKWPSILEYLNTTFADVLNYNADKKIAKQIKLK